MRRMRTILISKHPPRSDAERMIGTEHVSAGLVTAVRGRFSISGLSFDLTSGRKKTRCSGTQPCTLCSHAGSVCEFTAPYTRGRVPSVPVEENINATGANVPGENVHSVLESRHPIPGTSDQVTGALDAFASAPHLLNQHEINMGQSQLPNTSRVASRAQSSRNSPEPPQTDLQGHYVGNSRLALLNVLQAWDIQDSKEISEYPRFCKTLNSPDQADFKPGGSFIRGLVSFEGAKEAPPESFFFAKLVNIYVW
jgi:hypothetical protein